MDEDSTKSGPLVSSVILLYDISHSLGIFFMGLDISFSSGTSANPYLPHSNREVVRIWG
jgi:hypothetical protein